LDVYTKRTEREEKSGTKSLSERLIEQAEAEDSLAERFRHCSFMGEWPGAPHRHQASLLRQAALALGRKKRSVEMLDRAEVVPRETDLACRWLDAHPEDLGAG